MKICNSCDKNLPLSVFPECGKHTRKKDGVTVTYYRDTCRACFNGENRDKGMAARRSKFVKLIGWPAPVIATLMVLAIYSHDILDGRNRICFYESVYGGHAVTIDAMRMCPMTWEVGND